MKVRLKVRQLLALALLALLAAGSAEATKLGNFSFKNKHNFSKNSTATIRASEETRICIFCHTPHGATVGTTLWNRPDPRGANAFVLYDSGSPNTLVIDDPSVTNDSQYEVSANYPNGASRLCLSCHDGVVGIGEVNTGDIPPTDSIVTTLVTALDPDMAIDLSTSHPISFVYNATVLGFISAAKAPFNDYQLPSGTTAVKLDGLNRMQCTTCHDPHNDSKEDGRPMPFWRHRAADQNNDYDETCAECHLGSDAVVSDPMHNLLP